MSETDFKKKALLAIETLRARVRELEQSAHEDIAIVGYAARLPGAADSEAFWELLREGRDGISTIPADRWDVDAFYDTDPDAAGKMVTRRAGFIEDISGFDAQFFGIAPREASYMDPQHRLLLETTWHALEHAGLAASDLAGSKTGVFMGLSTHDYLGLLSGRLGFAAIEAYFATGTSPAAGAGRISYRFGFEGPAVTVDTACSSSLVAIHQACQALRAGECYTALTGGVNAILTPAAMINFSRARMLAPDGRCKTFDAAADGYVRGEGCGVIVLKRLSDAQRDGDRIRAVIRGSAVNQDGASGGLTVPNGRAQQRVIADALHQAGLKASEIDYLEAHGTGTSLGDPIEVQAAGAAFGVGREREQPLLIGSVKTNIGHLEAAAGIAGVIKVILALERSYLPKHLHFRTPSPHIPWNRLPVQVLREARNWERSDTPRRAGVSSFGFSGTNAHVIIQEGPAEAVEPPRAGVGGQLLWPLSARSAEALRALASSYSAWLESAPPDSLAAACYTAGVGRSHLEHRAALVVDSPARAQTLLAALAEDRPLPGILTGVSADPPKTAWLFTGQGSQYTGMARELYSTQPVFRETLDHCAAVLKEAGLPLPLLSVMFDAGQPIGNTAYAQPALFALEMGLARLWQHWGLTPDVVLGHSVGQYAAACVAGVFTLDDGLKLLAERGRLFGALPAGGRMAALFLSPSDVDARLAAYPTLSVAAYNGRHTVISGPAADVDAVVAAVQQSGARAEPLDTSHAFHSALLDPALDAFEAFARTITVQPPARTLICNRTGKVLTGQAVLDAAYWRKHARQPVQFAASVQTLATLGCKVLLELGPQPILTAMALGAWPESHPAPAAVGSLRKDAPDSRQIAEALARLYVAGSRPAFQRVDPAGPYPKVDLPLYPFQHRRFWFKATRTPIKDDAPANSEVIKLLEDGQLEALAARIGGHEDREVAKKVLQDLYEQHRRDRVSQSKSEDLYEVLWQKLPEPSSRPDVTPGRHWLVLSNDTVRAQALVDVLQASKQRATLLSLPKDDDPEELKALIRRDPPFRIVHLASCDRDASPVEALAATQNEILPAARRVVQAAIALEAKSPIWFVTNGAHRVLESDEVSPAQTALWGFGKVLALEQPELWGGLADVSTASDKEWQRFVLVASLDSGAEDHVALRGDDAYAARLARRQAASTSEPLTIRADATYLITGGLGVLGLHAAEYLAANGARHLVLTSRRSPDDRLHEQVQAIRDRHDGCQIRVMPADVSVTADVHRVLAAIHDDLPPLGGIVHAAGEVSSSRFAVLTDDEVRRVFAGKVWGAWRLTEALAGSPVDFFISFSSIASVWGSFGQAAYAAANAFLDGLAAYHRGHGIHGTAVNFGPWAGGMADPQAREQLARRGVQQLTPELALAGMRTVFGSTQGVVARVDWAAFLPVFQLRGKRPFLRDIAREYPEAVAEPVAVAEKSALVQRLVQAPADQRRRLLNEHLRQVVAETVRLEPEQIREEAGFFDLGMDSLMAIELRKRLEKDIGQTLPATMAIDHPRLSDAADFLLELLGLQGTPQAAVATRSAVVAGDPIAIVGLACRFPGAPDREAFWRVLENGIDAIREVPADRFDINEFYDPDPETLGKIYTRFGGFLDRVDGFDADLFGISPREAGWIDPQQRLMLETAWQGLEDAGVPPEGLNRSRTGVFVGIGANEYSHLLAGAPEDIDAYFITGNALNVIAGRVAFSLGLEGPALTIDTACSSSLVAVHEAAQALRAGECDLALAGGVNVLISPATTIAACRARMLAPDGRCKTFAASADGYVRGEGCGVIVLKRLSDARRDGDRIRAVIRGSAVNQDGASSGLTVPNGRAQQRVIADALQQADLQPADIDYLEAHGTGTSLGDPIEVQAAAAVLGSGRSPERPLLLGSVKTNVGHLESASGMAGLIKVVLSMEHDMLPRHLHFNTPSPHIPWDQLPVRVVSEARPWTKSSAPRRAGVSSFGFSGTNAHVVLEESPRLENPAAGGDSVDAAPAHMLWPLSGRSADALRALAARSAAWLEAAAPASLAAVCYTAAVGRSHLEHRAALVVDSPARAQALLAAAADDRQAPGLITGVAGDPPKTAWLFTGQGSQYTGMARELYATQPVFRDTLDHCADVLKDAGLPLPLLSVMFEADQPIGNTAYAQPALFALEMGLARLWQHWGLAPDVVLGHSVGQYAAACIAGVFTLDDGLKLLAERGRLFGALPAGGRMAALFLSPADVDARLADYPAVSVAAYNGRHTVISGPEPDVEAVVAAVQQSGARAERLDTSHAFHSALLDPALEEFEAFARTIPVQPPARTLICNRTGKVLTGHSVLDAAYWRLHARQPVQFAASVETLASLGCKVLLEIGPQPILTATALGAWPEGHPTPIAIGSLRKDTPDNRQIAEAAARLYVAGSKLNFETLDPTGPHPKVDLPSYPFQHRRFWPKTAGLRREDPLARGLVGSRHDLATGDVVYTSRFSTKHLPWLNDHVIYGTVVVPGATYAAMAMQAAGLPADLKEVFFYEPIVFTGDESRDVQLTVHVQDDVTPPVKTFQVHSRPHGEAEASWSLNASGTVATDADLTAPGGDSLETMLERLSPVRPQELFDGFAENELKWGPTWSQSLHAVWAGKSEAIGEIIVGEELATQLGDEPVHPVILDLCTGVAGATLVGARPDTDEDVGLFLPLKYERVTLREGIPRRFYCHAVWHEGGRALSETQSFDLHFLAPDGRSLGGITNFIVKRAPRQALLRGLGVDSGRLLYRITWREHLIAAAAAGSTTASGTWMVVGAPGGKTDLLRQNLEARGQRTVHLDSTLGAIDWDASFAAVAERGENVAGLVWLVRSHSISQPAAVLLSDLESSVDGVLGTVRQLVQRDRSTLPNGFWIVTERGVAAEPSEDVDPAQAAFWGLGRTIAAEQPTVRCSIVDHDGTADALELLSDLLLSPGGEPELAVRQRKTLVPRVMPWARSGQLTVPASEDYRLEPTERGAIDNLHLASIAVEAPAPGYVQVRAHAAGLNFRDILNVLGLYPGDPGAIGGELAGTVTAVGPGVQDFHVGQRVFGFSPGGAFATRVNVPFPFLAPQPDNVGAVEAATTPATFLTATLAFNWAHPRAGERVLIHAASGGVGLAAVQLALSAGAIVFATASRAKQKTLRDMGIEHIYDSRSTTFGDEILADTGGAGVDVVLNSLTNEGFVEATVRATAQGGRFVEIAKRDIWSPEKMAEARPDIGYHILALDEVMQHDPMRIRDLMAELASSLESGSVRPLPYQAYPVTEAKSAFRRMQQARHIGKIVISMPAALRPQPDRTYLLTGGLGALGLRTAAYLAQHGAGYLVLTSRRTPDAAAQQAIANITSQFGATVHVIPADVGDEAQVLDLLGRIRRDLPPLGGIAHLAGVVDDALIPLQSIDRIRAVLLPKAIGAWHLHHHTKNDHLDFFLLYSSASSVLGSPGQSNYAAANALLDGLAAHRHAHGLPGTSINWGPWAESGMAATEAARTNLGRQGLIPLKPAASLSALSEIVRHGTVQATVLHANWQRAAKLFGPVRPPMLEHVLPRPAAAQAGDLALLRQLHQVPAPQRGAFLTEHLQRELQQILGLAQPPTPDSRFLELGMDSLMAVELRNRLLGQFGSAFTISSTVVFDYPTIGALAEHLAAQTPEVLAAPAPAVPEVVVPLPSMEELQATVSDLLARLAPLRALGLGLPADDDESATDTLRIERAVLRKEADDAARDVLSDAALAVDVQPASASGVPLARRHALVTGATGYLGGYVLRDLLLADRMVTVLVRCASPLEGMSKVAGNLERMGIGKPYFAERLRVIAGDIEQPRFGLSQDAYDALAAEIDTVFHCAASRHAGALYSQVRDANVTGTKHVVEFLAAGGSKVLHLASSDTIFNASSYWHESGIHESAFPDSPLGNVFGLGQSKWAAESLARQARERGAQVVIYRPGALLGSTDTGFWSKDNFATQLMRHAVVSGTVSGAGRLTCGIPVDIAASFMVACSASPDTVGHTFHLVHPQALDPTAWAHLLTQHGMPLRVVSDDGWLRTFAAEGATEPLRALLAMRGIGINATIADCIARQPSLNGRTFERYLTALDVACPGYDALAAGGRWLGTFAARVAAEQHRAVTTS